MTLVAEIDGVALPDGALLITGSNIAGINGLPASAYYGEALTGGIQVDDPDGSIELEGLHVLTVDETACTGAERIWTGWISGRRVSRGPLPYKSGASRVWDVDIIEANWAFALMVFRASSAKRPAETDLVRAQFIIESAPMAFTPVVDNGRANFTDNPVNFDDSDLVTKYPIEGFNEFVGISGKNFYAYWDHDEAELSFHYDLMGVGPTSTLAISNDIADTDSTTFYPFIDAQLNMTGAWTVTGMLLGYRGAYAYGIRQATIDALSPTVLSPVEFQRDEVYRTDRIGRAETANATIVSMLDQRAEDQTTITVSIRVPAAQVNLIEQGMLVSFKATHLPGYETPVSIPVIRRTVVPTAGRTDMYDLHLELSGSPGTAGPGGGDPGPFPSQPAECNPLLVQSKRFIDSLGNAGSGVLDDTPTEGNVLVCMEVVRGTGSPTGPVGFTQIESTQADNDGQRVGLFFREVQPGDTATITWTGQPHDPLWFYVAEISGVGVVVTDSAVYSDDVDQGNDWVMPCGTVTTDPGGIVIGGGIVGCNPDAPLTITADNGSITISQSSPSGHGPGSWFGYRSTTSDDATYTLQAAMHISSSGITHGQGAISAYFECAAGPTVCPDAGVWQRDQFIAEGDGTTTTFFTPCPYADGSLNARVDGHPIIAGLTETDPSTGEFELDFAPLGAQGDAGAEQLYVSYQGRGSIV